LEFKGDDVPNTIAAFIEEYMISHLIVGRSHRSWLHRLFGQSMLDQLMRKLHNVDVIVVDNTVSQAV
jgi:two-component system sensor histidine kinase KdpD